MCFCLGVYSCCMACRSRTHGTGDTSKGVKRMVTMVTPSVDFKVIAWIL